MCPTIQGLVSRQSVPAQTQSLLMVYLAHSYVCGKGKGYILERRLLRETAVTAVSGGRGRRWKGGIHRWQQREIHVSARNLKRIDRKWFQKVGKGKDGVQGKKVLGGEDEGEQATDQGRIQLQDIVLSLEEWRCVDSRTAHFSGIRDESSVTSPESLGTKLVDKHPFIASSELWRILLSFRRRLYQGAGVKEIWDGMKLRKIDLPTEGPSANEFWRVFLKSALRDGAFLKEIWVYIQDLDSRGKNRNAWGGIYDTIIGNLLLTEPLEAITWHYRLYPRHTSRSLPELLTSVLQQRPDVHPQLREIHAATKEPAGVYSTIIPLLCTIGLHAEAVRWHNHCLSFKDLPEETSTANDLIKWVTKYGSIIELHRLLHSFVETSVKVVESSLVAIIIVRSDKQEAVRFILARSNVFGVTAMGDTFWAHVANQLNLERADIYKYLQTFGPGLVLGQETVEAIMRRFELPVDKAVWLLTEIGITLRGNKLAPKDSIEGSSTPIGRFRNRKTPMRDPPTIEELETSLRECFTSKDWKRFDSILRFSYPVPEDARISNIILQSDLYRGRLQESLHRIEHMRMHSIPVSTQSLHFMIRRFLRKRRRGHNPNTWHWYLEDDINVVIGLLFSLLRSGSTKVKPYLWMEIFKRLGMMRRLLDIEALAIVLVEWYHPTRSMSTRQRFVRATTNPSTSTATPATGARAAAGGMSLMPASVHRVNIPDRNKENPLRRLFPRNFFQAIIEWGFLTFFPYSPKTTPLIPAPPPLEERNLPEKYKGYGNFVSRFTWGIILAKRLRCLGVFVDPQVIVRGISVRLEPIFNAPKEWMTSKNINQQSAALNYLTLEEVVAIVEKAWGGKLYKRRGWGTKWRKRKITCEPGKQMFEVEDREMEIHKRGKWVKAMRKEVLGDGVPEVRMFRRWRRIQMRVLGRG